MLHKVGLAFPLSLILLQATFGHKLPNLGVIGGDDARPGQIPYQLSFEIRNRHYCGAAIISPGYALTAAHCTKRKNIGEMTVRAGTTIRQSGGQVVPVEKFINHPSYVDNLGDYDVAILKLQSNLNFNQNVQPVILPEVNDEAPEWATLSGWGQTDEAIWTLPQNLKFVNLPVLSKEDCRNSLPIPDNMICAGFMGIGGKDSCQGDSGGPLAANGKLVGLVTAGLGCGRPFYPGMYADIRYSREWIRENTGL